MQDKHILIPGRFQPPHKGHFALIRKAMESGKRVTVALMETVKDDDNPYTVEQRRRIFRDEFGFDIDIIGIPPIESIGYGREVGYEFTQLHHDLEDIRATDLRTGTEPPPPEQFDDKERAFVQAFWDMAADIHMTAREQGFWEDGSDRNKGEVIAHAHCELSEAFECLRMGDGPDKNIDDQSGVEVQLSDAIGILMDMACGFNLNLPLALVKKQRFNKTRGHMHGGKAF